MVQKLRLLLLVLLCGVVTAQAQEEKKTALVKGRIVSKANTATPLTDVQITIPYLKLLTLTDANGSFEFSRVPFGIHTVIVGGSSVLADTFKVSVNEEVVLLKDIPETPNDAATSMQSIQIPTIALEESDAHNEEDGASAAQNVSGLLTASRDPFLSAAAFVFGPYRFQPRGYERSTQQVLINGAPMNDVETNDAYWSQWGGLNDVFRGRSNTYGLQPSEYAFGGVNGTVYFDATAASQRKQTRVTYSASNRQYRNRVMLTHSTGVLKNGWAFSGSVSKRWADQGYVDGTYYDGYSYYLAASKKYKNHTFNLTTFGAPTRRGKMAPATQEAYDLAGSNFYNPNWGYQNGEVRNAKESRSYQPTTILNHEYAVGNKTRWNTSVAYQFGKLGNTTLDWYNAADPRPDYYKKLPTFYLYDSPPKPDLANQVLQELKAHPEMMQINWDGLINQNRANWESYSGNGMDSSLGRRSLYVVGNDIDDIRKWVFNTNLEHIVNDHVTLYTGVSFITQRTESYRELDDLLGGDFYVNRNQFSEQSNVGNSLAGQYDLNNPNRTIKEGDKYYYDYLNHFTKGWWWGQATFTFNKVDLYASANLGFNSFDREGLYRNGIFRDDSYGKSDKMNFLLYGLKGGATYKVSGRHYLFLNGYVQSDAPTVENTFISTRIRNTTVENPTEQLTYSMEGGYLLKSPKVNARVVGYVTDIHDAVEKKRYYREGENANSFVNYMMEGVDMRFIGTELALDVKLSTSVSVTGVAALGQAFYTNNPRARYYFDNFIDTLGITARTETPYIKNYYVASGPQSAYTAGLNYRSKKYWYANVNFNYFERNYIDVAPGRRVANAVAAAPAGSADWHQILDQEEFPSVFTIDLFGGKSFLLSKLSKKMPNSVFLYVNAGISNLLNSQNIRTGGFEQLRGDAIYNNQQFPPKYFYGYGRNFFVNLSLKF